MSIRAVFRNTRNEWRTGWRIVAMIVLLFAAVAAVNFGWKGLGLPSRSETGPWFFLLFAVLVSAAAFGVVTLLLRFFERRGPEAIGMPFVAQAWQSTAAGMLLGAMPICLTVGLAVLVGYGTVLPGDMNLHGLLRVLLPMLLAGFFLAAWEEFVLRGYLLRQLSIGINPAAAVFITAALFGLMHSGNPGANWQGLLYTAVGGILMGWMVVRTGSLWLMIGYHFGWNATASALFGLELSGFEDEGSVFSSSLSGADWLTGGSYGFEASLPTMVAEVLVLSVALRLIKPNRSAPLFA